VKGNAQKAYFGRRYALSASHRLHTEALTAAENAAAYGKCNNPHGHGHNYVVEVVVGGEVNAETGMVVNLADLDGVFAERVMERFDHRNLNLDAAFQAQVPTTENFCRVVFGLMRDALPAGSLEQVRIEETENNFFECHAE
jgi:6-pyruvoyltetrahydropterin/6-carboxytetrahydropterin synthase